MTSGSGFRRMSRYVLLTLTVSSLSACAPPPSVGAGAPTAATSSTATTSARGGDVLLAREIQESTFADRSLYEVVQKLRPHFLRSRAIGNLRGQAGRPVVVYVNRQNQGGVDVLRTISAAHVERVEYMSGVEATTKLGMEAAGGAILVTLK